MSILFFLMSLNFCGLAQQGVITGKLVDDKDSAIAMVTVSLMKFNDTLKLIEVISDKDGRFYINTPDEGLYYLKFSSTGFRLVYTKVFSVNNKQYSKGFGIIKLMPNVNLLMDVIVSHIHIPALQQLLLLSYKDTASNHVISKPFNKFSSK
ncbi:MAG TPA: carboxypeptidase-like regulatory domain-containing protein [Flavisolibacter sp.]|nr:carboxypeptidase-like regulatory domain-containing protein [Flavisolibacter sp.]